MYQDPIINAYIALIKAHTGAIKVFYQGEPVRIPASNLPCAIISKRETRVGPHTNTEDEHGIAMSITIITDIRQELSTEENVAEVVAGVASLYDIVEGRAADYSLKPDSLLAILRRNIAVDLPNNLRTDLASITRVDYGQTLRDRAPEQVSIEARVDFVSHFTQVR